MLHTDCDYCNCIVFRLSLGFVFLSICDELLVATTE